MIKESLPVNQIVLIIAFLINIFFCFLLLLRKKKETLIFAVAVIGLLIWNICVLIYPLFKDLRILYIIGIAAYWGPVIAASSILLFSYVFPKPIKPLTTRSQAIIIGGGILAILITLIPNFVLKGVTAEGYELTTGIGLYPLFFIIGSFLILALVNLIKKYFILDGIYKIQLKYLFIGIFLTFIIGFTTNAILAALNIYNYVWVGPAVTVIFVIFTSFAITRYHLFEIKVILTEFLVGSMGIVLTILPFFMPSAPLRFLTGAILFLFLIFGFLLIKATHEEVSRKEEAERLLKAKSEFLSIASHQLRTPLTAIAGYISMLKEGDYGRIPEEGNKAINKVYNSSQRMIKLVNDFLNVSRVETGRVVLNLSRVSLDEIILQIIAETELKVKQKGLFIKWNKPSLEPIVNVDPGKIKEVISNIVDNAIHYTNQGGITISAKIDPVKTTLMISDTGAGMDRDEIEKIFESFSRGSAGNKLYTQGSGLGLYIAKKFVELHGGRIWVESQGKDKGSAFYIELSNR